LKIVLSRKGFDSSVGGCPSPIVPDGTLLSLPIPTALDRLAYNEIVTPSGASYKSIMDEIGASARIEGKGAHLDPDLLRNARDRLSDWMPSLGQIGSAAGHLRNKNVAIGDVFLFYGWFRKTQLVNGVLRYAAESGAHVIFGYLQVGEMIRTAELADLPPWLQDHPHAMTSRASKRTNTIFVASKSLSFAQSVPGSGVFRFNEALVLTKPGFSRGRWNLDPNIFKHLPISYHTADAWMDDYFQSYPRAQEYVIDADVGAIDWATKLIVGSEIISA
jgi:hypothetical protein